MGWSSAHRLLDSRQRKVHKGGRSIGCADSIWSVAELDLHDEHTFGASGRMGCSREGWTAPAGNFSAHLRNVLVRMPRNQEQGFPAVALTVAGVELDALEHRGFEGQLRAADVHEVSGGEEGITDRIRHVGPPTILA